MPIAATPSVPSFPSRLPGSLAVGQKAVLLRHSV
jgi:hypothetical protein